MRDGFKVMIGGGQIDETVRAYTGADAFGVNAVEAVACAAAGWGWRHERYQPGAHHDRPV
jgi:hypothetical protein